MNTTTQTYAVKIASKFFAYVVMLIGWVIATVLVGIALGVGWAAMRKGFVIGVAVMSPLLGGCAATIRPTNVTPETVSLQYDTIGNSWPSVVEKAKELCGGNVEVMKRWDNIGTRGATFRCVRS